MNVYLIFLIAVFNVTCLRASRVVVSLFAIDLGAQQFVIGVLIAMYALFPALLALYAGRLSDRMGARVPMLAGSIGLVMGLLLPYAFPVLPALYVSAALFGMSYVFYHVSIQNLLGALSSEDERTRNFSNYSLMIAVGGFIGPLFAGFSIDHFGHRSTYLYLALLALVPVFTQSLVREHKRAASGKTTADGGHMPSGSVRDLFAYPPLRRTLISSSVVLTGTDLFQFYMPIYGHSIGLSASKIGFILSMVAAASFVVRIGMPALARKLGEETLLSYSLFLGAATFMVLPLFHDVTVLTLVALALGLALGCGQPLSTILTYARAPQGRRGEALGLRVAVNNCTHIVVPLVFGSIGSVFGVAPVFWANAVMLAGGGMLNRSGRA